MDDNALNGGTGATVHDGNDWEEVGNSSQGTVAESKFMKALLTW